MYKKSKRSTWPLLAATAIPFMVFMPQLEHRFVAAGFLSWGAVCLWQQAKRYQRKSRLLGDVFDKTDQSVISFNQDFTIESVNRRFGENTGFSGLSLVAKHITEVLSPRYSDSWIRMQFGTEGREPRFKEGKLWMRRRNGEEFPEYRYLVKVEEGETGLVSGYLMIGYSVEHEENQHALLAKRQQLDPLTSLPNRSRLQGLLDFILPKYLGAYSGNEHIDIALIDIDDFRMVNHGLGAPEGDLLLIQVAHRLRKSHHGAVVGRLGGDEFVIIQSSTPAMLHTDWQQYLQGVLRTPFSLKGLDEEVHLSFTVATKRIGRPDGIVDGSVLLQQLEQTMLRAKLGGGNHIDHHDPQVDRVDQTSLLMVTKLKEALATGEGLALYYQTQHCLKTDHLLSVEALLRWYSAEYGAVSPETFIPLAENHGLIDEIGAWVINESARQIAEWDANQMDVPRVWINVSPKQFFKAGLEKVLQQALIDHQIDASRIGLEITETDVLDQRAGDLKPRLLSLREQGYLVALDDFGTGHSSLNYLQGLPFDKVKLDRVFIQNLEPGNANEMIVASVVKIAKSCDAVVIAEGVETQAQIEQLLSLGCDRGQGYFYSKPVAASDLNFKTTERTGV